MKNYSFLRNPTVQMHLAVFLWGFTAILGKLITVNALLLVSLRMCFTALGFYLIPYTRQQIRTLTRRQIGFLALIGTVVCVHWLCFYHSIKVFNSSSIALICLGTSSMFVIWIEFLIRIRREISMLDVMISLVAIVGMSLIYYGNEVNTVDLHLYKWAIFYGIMAAMLASIFTIMNKKASKEIEPLAISFVEMMTGAILLFFVLLSQNLLPQIPQISLQDWFWILILSVVCTNIPFLLSIYALKKLNPFTVTLSVNLEPIYGILLAGIFFQEYKNFNLFFFIGSFLILISVFLPLIFNRDESK